MTCPTLTIRPAASCDLAKVDALLASSYPVLLKPDYSPSVLVTALPLIARANLRLLSSGSYFVVLDQDQIVGAGGWTWSAPHGGVGPRDMGHIRHVVVDHRRTRRGIGHTLMTRVVEDAASAGVGVLECLSTLTAVPFYSACGFHAIGPVEVTLRPGIGFPAVRMQRRIA
ncbi:MAG: GNAT family N-acetyltransferase [Rhodobacteraceae bacterium]|nr:GNAT family N-acetyltransferase [Paracoccaceae bacterium]